jgi:hypothetical protein
VNVCTVTVDIFSIFGDSKNVSLSLNEVLEGNSIIDDSNRYNCPFNKSPYKTAATVFAYCPKRYKSAGDLINH